MEQAWANKYLGFCDTKITSAPDKIVSPNSSNNSCVQINAYPCADLSSCISCLLIAKTKNSDAAWSNAPTSLTVKSGLPLRRKQLPNSIILATDTGSGSGKKLRSIVTKLLFLYF
ncbi:MAG: Uncharacterised protein [SAR116 cluster bacterium]|nr:MAG: Uncharacterised protein [SAR116 cluster bacterium]